jgi:alkaline phosphatase
MKTARKSVKAAGWILLVVLVLTAPAAAGAARHVLLFIGDGMPLANEIAASRYLYGRDDALSFHRLPYRGYVTTWDVTTYNGYARGCGAPAYDPVRFDPLLGYDPARGGRAPFPIQAGGIDDAYFIPPPPAAQLATDSASAATAMATGHKTDEGKIAWAPGGAPGGALTTIAELLRAEKGFSIGVVSTVPFTHATPAAFVSHNASRSDYPAIGTEIIRAVKPEVVIGGGFPGPGPDGKGAGHRYIGRKDYAFLKTAGDAGPYVFVERQSGADGAERLQAAARRAAASGRKLFGLFGGVEGNFESPRPQDLPGAPRVERATRENPTLADATLAALTVLSRDPDGFFAVIEQGDIDWANHANDFMRMVGTVWDLHAAVAAAVDFIDRPGDGIDWSNTLLIVTSDHGNSYMRLNTVLSAGDLPEQTGICSAGGPACTYPGKEVGYGSASHTNELVTLYARGALSAAGFARAEGSWYPGTRIIDNTQIFHLMAQAAGIPRKPPLAPQIGRAGCRDPR